MRRRLYALVIPFALIVTAVHADWQAGQSFKDCDECPEMVVIPAGKFQMGSMASGKVGQNAEPVHQVVIAKPFALGKTEITKKQWRLVMGVNPAGHCEDCPVEGVSWNAAQEFARRLSVKTAKIYRLPTEAEWEYACRAGGHKQYCGGDDINSVAWYEANSSGGAHAVAGKQANAFGLHDMSGNVWEWTADCWNYGYHGAPGDGSAWTSPGCQSRVIRGGSWQYDASYQAASVRAGSGGNDAGKTDGLRVARSLD